MQVISRSIKDTFRIASDIAASLKGGEVILLNGDLGAGKTTFTKGLALALGVEKTVTSPTFTIMKQYQANTLTLYHLDMYRVSSDTQVDELGLEDIFGKDSIVVIEWNCIKNIIGQIINIHISSIDEFSRELTIEGI